MNITYTTTQLKRHKAVITDDTNTTVCDLILYPMAFYKERDVDIEDEYTPYTMEMYIDNVVCSSRIVTNQDTFLEPVREAGVKMITDADPKCVFIAVNRLSHYNLYYDTFRPFLLEQNNAVDVLNHDQSQEVINQWPQEFRERFPATDWFVIMIIKKDHVGVYKQQWWNPTKEVKSF